MTRSTNPLNAILNWLIDADREYRATQTAINEIYH